MTRKKERAGRTALASITDGAWSTNSAVLLCQLQYQKEAAEVSTLQTGYGDPHGSLLNIIQPSRANVSSVRCYYHLPLKSTRTTFILTSWRHASFSVSLAAFFDKSHQAARSGPFLLSIQAPRQHCILYYYSASTTGLHAQKNKYDRPHPRYLIKDYSYVILTGTRSS